MTLLGFGLMTMRQLMILTVCLLPCLACWGNSIALVKEEASTGAKQNLCRYCNSAMLRSIPILMGILVLGHQMATYIWCYSR